MNRNGVGLFFFLLLSSQNYQDQQAFTQLQQLSGSWKMESSKGSLYETWEITGVNEMYSKSYKINASDTVMLEEVKLSRQDDGIFYIPTVRDQNQRKPVHFKMIASNNKKFVFENPAHDFPQRVIYHLVSQDSLHAWIEGKSKGKEARSDYYFKRLK